MNLPYKLPSKCHPEKLLTSSWFRVLGATDLSEMIMLQQLHHRSRDGAHSTRVISRPARGCRAGLQKLVRQLSWAAFLMSRPRKTAACQERTRRGLGARASQAGEQQRWPRLPLAPTLGQLTAGRSPPMGRQWTRGSHVSPRRRKGQLQQRTLGRHSQGRRRGASGSLPQNESRTQARMKTSEPVQTAALNTLESGTVA